MLLSMFMALRPGRVDVLQTVEELRTEPQNLQNPHTAVAHRPAIVLLPTYHEQGVSISLHPFNPLHPQATQ